jgi:hypothetical protein
VDKEERDGIRGLALLVDVVYVQGTEPVDVNVAREHGQFVDLGLASTPVPTIPPALEEALHVRQRHPVVPAGAIELVRQTGEVEFLDEVVEFDVGDGNSERFLGHRSLTGSKGDSRMRPAAAVFLRAFVRIYADSVAACGKTS